MLGSIPNYIVLSRYTAVIEYKIHLCAVRTYSTSR